MPTTLHDPKAPASIKLLQPVHQQHTQSNNPFAILEDDALDDNDDSIADNITVQANKCTNGATLGTSLQLVRQPARRSNTPMVSTNPISSLVHDLPLTMTPTLILQPRLPQSTHQQPIANPSTIAPQCLLRSTMPTIEPAMTNNQQPYPHYILPNDDKCDTNIRQPDPAICLLSTQGPASIAIHALYQLINLVFNNPLSYTTPTKLNNPSNRFQHNINIEEVCIGVVHPITKETITKYMKLMDDPALKGLWVPAMSKKQQCLAQGKEGVTVSTNTIFISHMMKYQVHPERFYHHMCKNCHQPPPPEG
jgi:hypothetical protein